MAVRAHEQRRLPLGVALADHLVDARDRGGFRARAGEQAVAGEDLVDRAGELRATAREDDQLIADPLEIGDDVRGEDDRDSGFGHRLQDTGEELPPRQRIERRDRLVEQQ